MLQQGQVSRELLFAESTVRRVPTETLVVAQS